MKRLRIVVVLFVACLAIGLGAGVSADQRPAPPVEDSTRITIRASPSVVAQIEPVDFFRFNRRAAFRLWQDYVLRADEMVRHVVVVFGDATIEGRVDGDVVVIFGQAKLASTAVVRGAVVTVAGNVSVASGAVVNQDLVVVGGVMDAPNSFYPGGEYIVIGAPWLGDRMRAVVPWFTRGLLYGRVIVPDLGWLWTIVFIFLIVSFGINQLMHGPVGACADTLAAKPFSTFIAGLLMLLLLGPISLLLAATVIGLVVVPFLWAAVVVAWTVGKVGVARWIGRGVTGQAPPETHAIGMRSFLIGFAGITLLYMVPVLGLMTWGIVGVFGLGAATQTFIAAVRRERPTPPKAAPVPPAPPPAPTEPTIADQPAAAAFVAVEPPAAAAPLQASPVDTARDIPPSGAAAAALPAGVAPRAAPVGADADLSLMPRATFLDRLAAFSLDVALILIAVGLLDFRRAEGPFFTLLFAYHIAFWAWKGTTVGGIICNLRVTRTDGRMPTFTDALVRGLSSFFSFAALGLGLLWILRDPDRQSWHDKIAGTLVVRVPRDFPLP